MRSTVKKKNTEISNEEKILSCEKISPIAQQSISSQQPVQLRIQTKRQDLLMDGKVMRASYNTSTKERFVHVTHVIQGQAQEPQRFIIGVQATEKDRNGEWGASLSILDALTPLPELQHVLVSADAGLCVEKYAKWLSVSGFFYLFRIKQNAGYIFEKVCQWAEDERKRRPNGDFFESARISGSQVHSRRLWRIPGLQHSIFPGITEGFMIEKIRLDQESSPELQYYITSEPQCAWSAQEISHRILGHWDTETGVFGTKDRTFSEDSVRYKHLKGALAHVSLINFALNCLWAPVFKSFWNPNAPVSHRIRFFQDNPDYLPFF